MLLLLNSASIITVVLIVIKTCEPNLYSYESEDEDEDADEAVSGFDPSFDVPILNVTVITGQTALLPCSIDHLGKHKVLWVDHRSIPLTYEEKRIVDDYRFTLIRPVTKEWNLQIREVRYEDQGQYRCTLNTLPVKSKQVTLYVKVPPAIIDSLSTNDLSAKEGETVVLVCNATGVPKPEVTWYKGGVNGSIRIDNQGEVLIIKNITRHCDDEFECLASNNVLPSVSRKIRVTVVFPPEVSFTTQRLGQVRGRDTILECSITANPQAQNFWVKDGERIDKSAKHQIDLYYENKHVVIMSLKISGLDEKDWGRYMCVASNVHGKDNKTMELYEYPNNDDNHHHHYLHHKKTTTTTTPTIDPALANVLNPTLATKTKYWHVPPPHHHHHQRGQKGHSGRGRFETEDGGYKPYPEEGSKERLYMADSRSTGTSLLRSLTSKRIVANLAYYHVFIVVTMCLTCSFLVRNQIG